MPAKRPVYRKVALDKLSSPEELDRLMQITRPGAWLLLAAFGGVLLVVVLWGVFGQITTTLEQSGVLTMSNPVAFVLAEQAGQVVELPVQPGDIVDAGEVVALVETGDGPVGLTSAVRGRVISIRVGVGEPVDIGTPLVSISAFARDNGAQEVVAFVPLDDQQRIRVGMDVQVLPSTVERERYGNLKGRVQAVAQFASTRDEILSVLDEQGFIDDLTATGPVFEVRIVLRTNADGSLVWTASNGPDTSLVSGTPCLIQVNVDRERPISKVLNLAD